MCGYAAQIDLGANRLGDEGCKAIAKGISVSGSLTSLSIGDNNLGDEGVEAISVGVMLEIRPDTMLKVHRPVGKYYRSKADNSAEKIAFTTTLLAFRP